MMKKSMIGMAAVAAVLFGMAACGHAENSEASVEAEKVNVPAPEAPLVDHSDDPAVATVVEQWAGEVKLDSVWTETPSGLKYKVIKKGEGKMPRDTDAVLVNYEGKLINGEKFDSSYDRNEPIAFPLNQVIAGWTEGLQLMPEGSIYVFYIPSELAYGHRGAGPIAPDSDLLFLVELLEVEK